MAGDGCSKESVATPPAYINRNLAAYWTKPVAELAAVSNEVIEAPDAERHRIYALLTMAITANFWNGNKRGQDGTYPWRTEQRQANGSYKGDGYLGHNIAAVAVAANGEVIDFEFNHNEIFNSSAEHAEARLVRRVFNLNQIYDGWQTKISNEPPPSSYGTVLTGVTIYTSLESCAQCAGIMTLGNVNAIVYLQTDPGQYRVGNLLYNLTRPLQPPKQGEIVTKYGAPEPIAADLFGFEYKHQLDEGYRKFVDEVSSEQHPPFFVSNNPKHKPDRSTSVTTFLCTDPAMDVFEAARVELETLRVEHPDHKPARASEDSGSILSNEMVLDHARAFLNHVRHKGRRGTPHR